MCSADLSYSFCHWVMQQLGRDGFAELLFTDNRQVNVLFESCRLLLNKGCLYVVTPDALSVKTSGVMDEHCIVPPEFFQCTVLFYCYEVRILFQDL